MNEKNIRMITLKNLFELFLKRLVVILLGAVLATGSLYLYQIITYEPEYTSTATLYILRQDDASGSEAADDFSLALKLVTDCKYLLKSHAVLDEVIGALDLKLTYKELYNSISISNPSNTRILEVTVKGKTPNEAKAIVDSLCIIGTEKIDMAMGIKQINLFEYGTLNEKPVNGVEVMICILAGIGTAVAIYSVFLIFFLLDDRIQADDDLEKILGLSILADIPDANEVHKGNYGYYKQSSKKSKTKLEKKGKEAK